MTIGLVVSLRDMQHAVRLDFNRSDLYCAGRAEIKQAFYCLRF